MAEKRFYPPHLWGYLRRVFDRKLKDASLAKAIEALNAYKPTGFDVTLVGQAEKRRTIQGDDLVGLTLSCESKEYAVFLTTHDIKALRESRDPRTFVPSVQESMVEPKKTSASA